MTAQQRTLDDLKIGIHVQIDKAGRIRFGEQPMMDLPSVKIIDMVSVAQLEDGIEHIKAWASQPRLANMDERQVLNAVIRMCDDIIRGEI